jgi:hypothetical protein
MTLMKALWPKRLTYNGLHQGHSKQFNHMVFTSLIQTFWPPDFFHQCHFNISVTRPSLVSIKHFSHKAFIGVFQTFWTLGRNVLNDPDEDLLVEMF